MRIVEIIWETFQKGKESFSCEISEELIQILCLVLKD